MHIGWWAVALFAIFLIGVTKSGFGSGVGLIIIPMITIAMTNIYGKDGAEVGLGILLPLLIVGDVVALWQYRKLLNPIVLKRLGIGATLGISIGGLLLWWFKEFKTIAGALVMMEVGGECIVLVSLHWWRQWRGMQEYLMPEPWRGLVTGTIAGISTTLAHAAGPIIMMYLLPLRLERQLFVGSCAVYFFTFNTAKLPVYWWAGMFEKVRWWQAFACMPLVLAGAVFGFWITKRMSDKAFTKVVYVLSFLLGWYILVDGARELSKHL